jgi:MFS family permease
MGIQRSSALAQVLIVSFVCFCCPGLFNALTSFSAGMQDVTVAYNGNSVLYGCFAVSGLLSGGLVNFLGPRRTLFIGTWGYVLYAGSLLYLKYHNYESTDSTGAAVVKYNGGANAFFLIACAILGLCAGLLWTAQGQMCMAYPTKANKGLYFSIFWVIFNLGATMGGFISFGTNYNDTSGGTSTGTYVAFLVIMACGAFVSMFLSDPSKVVRNDGTMVKVEPLLNWKVEAIEIFKQFASPKMMLLFPLFAYSNWFSTYHSLYNSTLFNSRSTGFSSGFYWAAQMLGAFLAGLYLDAGGVTKRRKAQVALIILFALVNVMWILGTVAQVDYDISYTSTEEKVDFKDSGKFTPRFLLYMFYGFNDAICQLIAYWVMGQMSDDIRELGHFAGFYKAVQSAMAAVSWKIGAESVDPLTQLIICWVLAAVGIVLAYFTVTKYVPDTQIGSEEADEAQKESDYRALDTQEKA